MAMVRNSVGADCYVADEIITSRAGVRLRVGNTDAEGRLVLSDTMTYVQRNYAPKQIIDLATLTGSIMVALGTHRAGAFTNDEDGILQELNVASKESFENIWHMPVDQEHIDGIKG